MAEKIRENSYGPAVTVSAAERYYSLTGHKTTLLAEKTKSVNNLPMVVTHPRPDLAPDLTSDSYFHLNMVISKRLRFVLTIFWRYINSCVCVYVSM